MAKFASVFKRFLHVNNSTVVENVEVIEGDDGVVRSIFNVRPAKRMQCRCPHCLRKCPVYATSVLARLWRALDCGGTQVYLRYAVPRVTCPKHGVVTSAVSWAFHDSWFSKTFDMQVSWLAKHMTRKAVSDLMQIDWKTH